MSTLTIRKNFNFDKELIDKASLVIANRNQSFTQVLTNYFQAIVKEPSIIDTIELKATQRTGAFIGMFDGMIGNTDYKDMKKAHNEDIS